MHVIKVKENPYKDLYLSKRGEVGEHRSFGLVSLNIYFINFKKRLSHDDLMKAMLLDRVAMSFFNKVMVLQKESSN